MEKENICKCGHFEEDHQRTEIAKKYYTIRKLILQRLYIKKIILYVLVENVVAKNL